MSYTKKFFDKIRANNKLDKFKDSFKNLETDQERIIYILNHMSKCNISIRMTTGMLKNAERSEELRKQGTKLFITREFSSSLNTTNRLINCLKFYTQSIAFAPYPSKELALAYDKRSQVLFQLGLYSKCIKDIDRTLKLKYLNEQKAQLYLRKAECLLILKKRLSAKNFLKKAQHWLDKMPSNNPDRINLRLKLDILKLYRRRTVVRTKQSVTDNILTRTKVKKSRNKSTMSSYNTEVPCASDAVAIKYDQHYGRHVIATRDIKPGEVIAVEEPYTLLLSQDNVGTHCSNCLEVCWANIPCKYCTCAMYCSKKCRDNEWIKCHEVECNVFPALIECGGNDRHLFSVRLAVLALREAEGNMENLQTMIEDFDQCNDPRTKNFSRDGKLQSDKYIGVYNLATNTKNRTFRSLFTMTWNTCIILYHLATRTKLFDVELPTDCRSLAKINSVTFFGGLILRHQQIISINNHTITEAYGLRIFQRGSALMPFCSLINHSCNPNILRQSRFKHFALHAIYPIQKGQQLFDSYGPYYVSDEKDIRKRKLKKNYLFNCNCVACQKNLQLYELPSYMTLVEKAEDKDEIEKALKNLETYYDLTEKNYVDDKPYIKEELLKMIQILHNYTPIPCKEAVKVIITLTRIYMFEGNRFELPTRQT